MFATKVFPQGGRHDLKGGHFMAVLHLTKENFESEVLKSDKKVLVDFGQLGVDHVRWFLLLLKS